jgi:hypothetical protein
MLLIVLIVILIFILINHFFVEYVPISLIHGLKQLKKVGGVITFFTKKKVTLKLMKKINLF